MDVSVGSGDLATGGMSRKKRIVSVVWLVVIVSVVAVFFGRRQLHDRNTTELRTWLSENDFVFLEEHLMKAGIQNKVDLLLQPVELELLHMENHHINDLTSLASSPDNDIKTACKNSDAAMLKAVHNLRSQLKKNRRIVDEKDIRNYFRRKHYPSVSAIILALMLTVLPPGIMLVSNNIDLSRITCDRLPRILPSYDRIQLPRLQIPTSKSAIFEFFTGHYPAPQCCEVLWDWNEPQAVGKTMTFSVRFFQKNKTPYPISDIDNVLVEIVHQNAKVATTMECGSSNPKDVNMARVSFTVHKSGEYIISVMVGGRHIKGSPFTKTFEPGPIDASKTGFMHYTSTVVCAAGTSHPLTIETRDAFNNLAAYRADQSKHFFKLKVEESGTGVRYTPTTQILYSVQEKRLMMFIKMEKEGCYQATVSYGDIKLKNGEFNIIVLSSKDPTAILYISGVLRAKCCVKVSDELSKVNKTVVKRRHNLWYEVRLLACNNEKLERPKKVYLYISPKQLTLKEFYFKIYPRKLFTFRVCPSTKFTFNGFNNQVGAPSFTIDDGAQQLVLASKDRNTIAATFFCFLLQRIGGSETFHDKQTFFNHEVRQLHARRAHTPMPIKIDRSRFLHDSYKTTKSFDLGDWCRLFEVSFTGEEGLDWGGLRREWFELLCTELFDPARSGLFKKLSSSSQSMVHPNPRRPPELKLKYYEFAGKIVGKCLYESSLGRPYRQLVKARFSRSFLAQLIGLRVNYKYFETDDPELYTAKIKFIEENDIDDMELTFTEEEYDDKGQLARTVELIPGGANVKVTGKNKLQYLDALAQYRLANSVKEEVEYFLRGLNELIPDNLLSIFDEYELELLMCGMGTYSLADFKNHHTVCAPSPSFNKVLDWFWTVVAGFTEEQMARLLQFTTGCSQLPPGGFGELNPKIQLSPLHRPNTLPIAHTCFNQLCLPSCDNIELFHRNLLTAINEGCQGFGMV
ncbi:hypothetical protein BaRGS_00015378 [Batillaria attramentaria]|uniref:HECT-type E3 ubiquitin transferase n=1 Tax=Batillaria attramentaria TaxID=370345 RepID=A0ABD0L1S2_9CAEN